MITIENDTITENEKQEHILRITEYGSIEGWNVVVFTEEKEQEDE